MAYLTIKRCLQKLAVEEKRLNDFTHKALQAIGEHVRATSLSVSVRDTENDKEVLFGKLSHRQNGDWEFSANDNGGLVGLKDTDPDTMQFPALPIPLNFSLDLPDKWQGELQIALPLIGHYLTKHHCILRRCSHDFSLSLHIALLNSQTEALEKRLKKEVRIKQNLQDVLMAQGKRLRALKRKTEHDKQTAIQPEIFEQQPSEADASPPHSRDKKQPVFTKQILKEIEHSRKMALLGELASGVAHQIRNPLNNLVATLHLIRDKDTPKKNRAAMLDHLTERIETIDRMISEFIYYTQITRLNRTPEDINAALKNTLGSFEKLFDLSGIKIETLFDDQLPLINIDLYLMDQVFHNIIKNALEAMKGSGRLSISVQKLMVQHGPRPRLKFIEISFKDTGHGIPKKDVKKVLDPFYSKKSDGMGLGLSIVKHVVRVHGGAVRIKSRPGRFTNVIVYLPIR